MPMNFPDMKSLMRCAEVWKFRQPHGGEKEADYRRELAKFVLPSDPVEAGEIKTGKGWDLWNESEKLDNVIDILSNRRFDSERGE